MYSEVTVGEEMRAFIDTYTIINVCGYLCTVFIVREILRRISEKFHKSNITSAEKQSTLGTVLRVCKQMSNIG